MSNSIYQQTEKNLTALRLNQMKLHLEEISNNVGSGSLSFTEGLLKLTNYELVFKENSASQNTVHAAAFPSFVKTLMDFDFTFQPSVSEKQMQEFCSLGFMERAENIVFLGSSGVGKTHLATAIGVCAARHHNIKLMKKHGLDLTLLDDVVDDLRQGKTLDEKYKDHILKGDYVGFHECHIKPD